MTTAVENTETKFDTNIDSIPQFDGQSETKDVEQVTVKKEEEPVIFKMLDNGYAETKKIAPGETPPASVYHTELGIGSTPRQRKWGDRVGIEYVFKEDNVEIEMYQVI